MPSIILINHYPNWLVPVQPVISINTIGYIKKTKLKESVILYIQTFRFFCLKGMSPVVFLFVRIFRISFINKDNGNVIKKTIAILTWEVLLHACFFPKVFSIILFVIIPSKTKVIDSLTYTLQFALVTSEQIYTAFVFAVKTMIDYILLSTELEKVLFSVTFRHTWQRLPLYLNDPTILSRGQSFALAR